MEEADLSSSNSSKNQNLKLAFSTSRRAELKSIQLSPRFRIMLTKCVSLSRPI
jgi:hypothetical protein